MDSLIQLVSSHKQVSLFLSTFTGILPDVALSKGKLFKIFLKVASETHCKENFLFSLNFC